MNRMTWGWVAAIGLFLALGAGLVIWDHLQNPQEIRAAADRLDQAFARAKAAGVPLTLAEVPRSPGGPEDKNAWPLIKDIMTKWEEADVIGNSVVNSLGTNDRAALINGLGKLHWFLGHVEDTRSAAFIRPPNDYLGDMRAEAESLSVLRPAGVLLAARAVTRAQSGDSDRALKDLTLLRHLAQLIGSDYSMRSTFVQVDHRRDAAQVAGRLAAMWAGDAEKLRALEAAFTSLPMPSQVEPIKVDAYLSVIALRNYGDTLLEYGELKRPPGMRQLSETALPKTTQGRAFLAMALEAASEMLEPASQLDEDPTAVRKQFWRTNFGNEDEWTWQYYALEQTSLFRDESSGGLDDYSWLLAVERTQAAKIAVLRFKAERGRFPKTLADAGVKSLDPFAKSPLKYSTKGDSFRVWSVGQDLRDSGGLVREELAALKRRWEGEDLVAAYPATFHFRVGMAWSGAFLP